MGDAEERRHRPHTVRDSVPTWAAFLRSQAEAILACDFVVIDLLDRSKAYVAAVIEHATRHVRVLGATLHAGATMKYLIHDRDASFSAAFDAVFSAAGIETIRTGINAPRQNSITERWFRSLRANSPTAH